MTASSTSTIATRIPAPRPYVGIPLTWTLIVLVLTLTPAQDMPETPEWNLLAFDTASHAFVFAVLSFCHYFSAVRQRRYIALRRAAALWVGLECVALGALIELLQMAMPFGRHGEWSDLLSDVIGVVAGLLAGRLLKKWIT